MRSVSCLLLGAALLLGACRGALLSKQPADALLAAHRGDVRAEASPRVDARDAPPPWQDRLRDLRAQWEARLEAPASSGEDAFLGEEGRAALRAARGEDFADRLGRTLTLEHVLAGVYVRNPTLEAARTRLRGTLDRFAQVAYLDTILRQYASFLRSASQGVRPSLPGDTVARHFPFPGTLELQAAVVSHTVEAAQAKYTETLREVLAAARSTYADLVYAGRTIAITEETLRYLEQIEEAARGKLSAGATGKSHVIQVQVQIAQIENDLLTSRREADTLRARLRALLDLPPEASLATPVPPPLPRVVQGREALLALALETKPAVVGARARAARRVAMIELAEQGTYPALSAGLSVFEDASAATAGSGRDREPFTTRPKVVPDPFFGSKDAYLREAREAERAARALVRAAEAQSQAEVIEAANALDTARSLRDLYREVQLAQARQAYEDAFASYGVDRAGFMDVMDALRQWLRFRLAAHGAERDLQKAFARLEQAVGMPL